MTGSEPATHWPVWLMRLAWPLPGAYMGAALGFNLYFSQPGLNRDTLAPAILASLWALCGLVIGVLGTGIIAWLIQRGLRRLLSTSPPVTAAITLLCLIGLCGRLYAPLNTLLPTLLISPHQTAPSRTTPAPERSTCAQAPPSDPAVRKEWELECR